MVMLDGVSSIIRMVCFFMRGSFCLTRVGAKKGRWKILNYVDYLDSSYNFFIPRCKFFFLRKQDKAEYSSPTVW